MKLPQVLSFDPKRVKFIDNGCGPAVIEKTTTFQEYRQITKAREYLKINPIILSKKLLLLIPAPILKWKNKKSVLITLFCNGINGEQVLRTSTGSERSRNIKLFKECFQKMRLAGFLWGDFAPRNMIIDEKSKRIWIVDFERQLELKNKPVAKNLFSRYIRNYSLEEFSCFLFTDEQKKFFSNMLTKESMTLIPASQIRSKRKGKLLTSLFGQKKYYKSEELQTVEALMVFVATPFFINGIPLYPMDLIDRMSKQGGANTYVQIVQKIRWIHDPQKRYHELQKMANAFK